MCETSPSPEIDKRRIFDELIAPNPFIGRDADLARHMAADVCHRFDEGDVDGSTDR